MTESFTRQIRESYDRLAGEYARRLSNELQGKPMDREVLLRFAIAVRGRGEVCDVGCGPGHVARFLKDAGARVFGLDLSPEMVKKAEELHPDISFQVGDMMALALETSSLAGIVGFYAIVNIPKDSLPCVFREMARVLQPDGLLLLAFHIGDEVLHRDELWGYAISMDFFFFQTSEIGESLEKAGFVLENIIERDPYAPDVEYPSRRAYVLARKRAVRYQHS